MVLLGGLAVNSCASFETAPEQADRKQSIARIINDVAEAYDIPGLAIASYYQGKEDYFEHGRLSLTRDQAVTRHTLFEIGSISKLFNTTLALSLERRGKLKLTDPVCLHYEELCGFPLGSTPLFHLATHTAGGFPLQLPDTVDTPEDLIAYYRAWRPAHELGTFRSYANPSIGLLGLASARVAGADYRTAMEETVFQAFGLTETFIEVPKTELQHYASGHNRDNEPRRLTPALLSQEAYGVRTTSTDLLAFLKLHLDHPTSPGANPVVAPFHKPYFATDWFEQHLIWEGYRFPLSRCNIDAGHSRMVILDGVPVVPSDKSDTTRPLVLSKTGSTGGFGAYVMAIPDLDFAITILANKSFPNRIRVMTAAAIGEVVTGLTFIEPDSACRED